MKIGRYQSTRPRAHAIQWMVSIFGIYICVDVLLAVAHLQGPGSSAMRRALIIFALGEGGILLVAVGMMFRVLEWRSAEYVRQSRAMSMIEIVVSLGLFLLIFFGLPRLVLG